MPIASGATSDHVAFKFLKQHLRVKSFGGNSENAVRMQIYVAIIIHHNEPYGDVLHFLKDTSDAKWGL